MTTIVNSPSPNGDNNSVGIIFGVIALIIFGLIFVYFGIPALRKIGTPQINIPAPVINVPDKIDVNVEQTP